MGYAMKLFDVLAAVGVGSLAALGFVAGSLVAGAAPAPALDVSMPAKDMPDLAILNAAEERMTATQTRPATTRPAASNPAAADPAAIRPATGPHLVKMANVTQPVRKTASVSFVVAEVAIAVSDAQSAAHYEIPQNAARLQAAIEQAMASAANTPILRGISIDSQQLSGKLTSELQADFADIEDVLFLTLYKHDIGYN